MLAALKKLMRKLGVRKNHDYDWALPQQSATPEVSRFTSFNTTSTATLYDSVNAMSLGGTLDAVKVDKIEDLRIEKKPVEIVNEIIAPDPVLRLNDLPYQIKAVEARLKVLRKFRGNTSDEEWALRYLKARQHYEKKKKMFTWPLSTDELINALIKKYKVSNNGFGGYSRNIPLEATAELEKFGKAWDQVVDDERHVAELRLITDYGGKETKKDPILLAASPFGRWWYVLGAWDKEVEIVDEIIYNGK